jgi:MFS family permease
MTATQPAPPARVHWDALTWTIGASYALLAWTLGHGAVVPSLRDDLDFSATVAALHAAWFGWGLLAGGLVAARLVRWLGRGRIIAVGWVGMTAGALGFGLGQHVAVTLLGSAIGGVSGALTVVVLPGLIADQQGAARTQAMGVLNAFPMVSATALPLSVAAAVGLGAGWRVGYLVPALAISAVMLAVAMRVQRPIPQGFAVSHDEPATALRTLMARPAFRLRWLVLVLGVVCEISTGLWAAQMLKELAGATEAVAVACLSVQFAGMTLGRLALPRLLASIDEATLVTVSFVLVAAGFVPLWTGPGLAVRVAGLAVIGCGLAALYPVAASRLFEMSTDASAVSNAAGVASGVAITVGPFGLGVLADLIGLRWAALVLPAAAIVGIALSRRR